MDFVTNIYGLILNLIKTLLDMFNVDTSKVDELLGAIEKDEAAEEETTVA